MAVDDRRSPDAASGVELSLTAEYPPETFWTIHRDGRELVTVQAAGPLSALVRFGALAAGRYGGADTKDYNAKWEVERVTS